MTCSWIALHRAARCAGANVLALGCLGHELLAPELEWQGPDMGLRLDSISALRLKKRALCTRVLISMLAAVGHLAATPAAGPHADAAFVQIIEGSRKRARPDEASSAGPSGSSGVIAIREGDDKDRPPEEVTQLGYQLLDVVLNRIDPE